MSRANRWAAALLVLITCGGVVLAQAPPKPGDKPAAGDAGAPTPADKLSLEELLGRALKEHPDVRVAEAKLREAEAELSRARMLVAQKVIALHGSLALTRRQVEDAEKTLARLGQLQRSGAAPEAEVRAAEAALLEKKAELARLEAELPLLLGQWQQSKVDLPGDFARWAAQNRYDRDAAEAALKWLATRSDAMKGDVADKIRKSLDATIQLKVENKTVGEVLDVFKEAMGVSILDLLPKDAKDQKVSLVLSHAVPTGAALMALSDATGLQFSVREYGILVTRGDLPAGAVPLQTFWKGGPDKPQTTPDPKKP